MKYLDPVVVSKLKNIEIKARMIVEGFITGYHRSPHHGFSVEFSEHKAYNPGESYKNVDWKVYGKTDKLYTKKYEEETNLRCQVVLDISDSMRYPDKGISKLEYGAYLAASLQYLMIRQRDATGLTLFDEEIRYNAPAKSKHSWLVPMLRELENVIENKNLFTHRTSTPKVIHELARKFHRRSFVILITDLLGNAGNQDEMFNSLRHLRHELHEVIVFNLLDKKTELEFELPNRPTIFKDLETGEEIRIHPQQVRGSYREMIQEYKNAFRKKCHEFNIDFVDVDIAQGFDKTLTDYLIKRRALLK